MANKEEIVGKVQDLISQSLGVSPDEIREIIMHAAVYCGYPAALAAMKVAKEVVEAYQA